MATTTATSNRNLTSRQSLTYVRPTNIRIDVREVRPNTILYVFFDGVAVSGYCAPIVDNIEYAPGSPIISSGTGTAVIMFRLPGGTFLTGAKTITVSDTKVLADLNIINNTFGSAEATFTSAGTLETYQTVATNVSVTESLRSIWVPPPPPPPPLPPRRGEGRGGQGRGDPLAQSFFTFGQKGGVFVTSIDLFFRRKPESGTAPGVSVDIRPMINGVPATIEFDIDRIVSLNASEIKISSNAQVATNFKFKVPIYLPEDGDYSFIVMSNSKDYELWSSRMGEKDINSGNIIFEQPYIGSIFKSENNTTWVAEQFEDIKFKIYKARFNTTANITLTGSAQPLSYSGECFETTAGSNVVIYKSIVMHGLTVGSKIVINGNTGAVYNGITNANISGIRYVNAVFDEYTVSFVTGANATISGKIYSASLVREIAIINGGSGYTSASISINNSGTGGTGLTLGPVSILDGSIIGVTITNPGTGYNRPPLITVTGNGSGAVLLAVTEADFTVAVNKPVNLISPQIDHSVNGDSNISATTKTVREDYGTSTLSDIDKQMQLNSIKLLPEYSVIASRTNEHTMLANANSFELNIKMETSNPNVSPTIDMRSSPSIFAYNNAINTTSIYEDEASLISSGSVIDVVLTNGGSNYNSTPSVAVLPAENETNKNITVAVITANISGGEVDGLILVSAGSGYTKPPLIKIAAANGGVAATATCSITKFNSEVGNYGTAYSRYLTKKIKLETASNAIRLIATIGSTYVTDVDWYIRTSLSSDDSVHENNDWKILKCDAERNKSASVSELFEYEFYTADSTAEFDTYDLKCILKSTNKAITPYVRRYRVIAIV